MNLVPLSDHAFRIGLHTASTVRHDPSGARMLMRNALRDSTAAACARMVLSRELRRLPEGAAMASAWAFYDSATI